MLRRITALNYRCLRYVDQPVGPFQVLVGPNASGKSAFLDVLQLISDILEFDLREAVLGDFAGRAGRLEELVFNQVADHFEVAVELAVPERLKGPWANRLQAFARYELAVGTESRNGELAILGETLWRCVGRPPATPARIREPALFPVEPTPPSTVLVSGLRKKAPTGWRKIVSKTPKGRDYFRAETSNWNNEFRVGSQRSALANLPEDRDKFPVGLWVRDSLREGITHLHLDTDEMRDPVSPSESRTFLPDGSNLPLVITDLQRRRPDKFEAWLDHVRTVLADVNALEVLDRPEDNHSYIAMRYAGGDGIIPSWLLSDGTLRFLALTLLPYLDVGPTAYLVEEPEDGMHPRAIHAVYDSLSSVYEGHVSVATHSPLIVSLAAERPEQILCFSKTASGATDIVPGNLHPALQDWRGQPDLSVLYAAGVLG